MQSCLDCYNNLENYYNVLFSVLSVLEIFILISCINAILATSPKWQYGSQTINIDVALMYVNWFIKHVNWNFDKCSNLTEYIFSLENSVAVLCYN